MYGSHGRLSSKRCSSNSSIFALTTVRSCGASAASGRSTTPSARLPSHRRQAASAPGSGTGPARRPGPRGCRGRAAAPRPARRPRRPSRPRRRSGTPRVVGTLVIEDVEQGEPDAGGVPDAGLHRRRARHRRHVRMRVVAAVELAVQPYRGGAVGKGKPGGLLERGAQQLPAEERLVAAEPRLALADAGHGRRRRRRRAARRGSSRWRSTARRRPGSRWARQLPRRRDLRVRQVPHRSSIATGPPRAASPEFHVALMTPPHSRATMMPPTAAR